MKEVVQPLDVVRNLGHRPLEAHGLVDRPPGDLTGHRQRAGERHGARHHPGKKVRDPHRCFPNLSMARRTFGRITHRFFFSLPV